MCFVDLNFFTFVHFLKKRITKKLFIELLFNRVRLAWDYYQKHCLILATGATKFPGIWSRFFSPDYIKQIEWQEQFDD